MAHDSEDYDFTPTPSGPAALQSLFENPVDCSKSTLKFSAPIQPKPGVSTEIKNESGKTESSTLCAYVVQVWKLTDGEYIAAGRHGVAIIGFPVKSSYEIILYKEKRNVIARTTICPCFRFYLNKDGSGSFYDSSKENWLIKFYKREDCLSVLNQIEKCGGQIVTDRKAVQGSSSTEQVSICPEISCRFTAPADVSHKESKVRASASQSKNTGNVSPHATFYTRSPPVVRQPSIPTQPDTCDNCNVFVAENRTHHSEIRMILTQILEKLNYVIKTVDKDQTSDADHGILESRTKVAELKIDNLLKDLTTALEENKKLKQQILEQSSMLNTEHESRVKAETLHEESTGKVEALEEEIISYKKKSKDLSEITEVQKSEIKVLLNRIDILEHDSKNEIPKLESKISELEQKLKEVEQQDRSSNSLNEGSREKCASFIAMLKEEMNEMYANIIADFEKNQVDVSETETFIIAQNIKSTTLNIIQKFQQHYENK